MQIDISDLAMRVHVSLTSLLLTLTLILLFVHGSSVCGKSSFIGLTNTFQKEFQNPRASVSYV
jgi:hypothetical protein